MDAEVLLRASTFAALQHRRTDALEILADFLNGGHLGDHSRRLAAGRERILVKGINKFQLVPRENREVVFGCAGFEPRRIAAAVTAMRRAIGRRDSKGRSLADEYRIARV